jgi:acyl dehydratase
MMTAIRYFEDHVVGERTRTGTYALTREEVIAFATQYDPQDFHLDDEAAARSHFGRIAASGWNLTGIWSRLNVERGRGDGAIGAVIAGAGIDELRWLVPVYPGDVLRGESEVIELTESRSKPDRGIMKTRHVLLNQKDEVVMSMVTTAIMKRRPTDVAS